VISPARREDAIKTELAWATARPFEVTGYRVWLAADVPLLTIKLRTAFDKATFGDAVKAIDRKIAVDAIDQTTFEIAVPSCSRTIDETVIRFGDVPTLKKLFEQVFEPLHRDLGIERVTMGGTTAR
jgi:hypothetical protein